jgi:glutathione peroxidase
MKRIFIFGLALLAIAGTTVAGAPKSVHEFSVADIDGKQVSLKDYQGKVLLMVNVASRCGYTRQYQNLVKLQEAYQDKGLVVMGFPANNFGKQEPGTNTEIKEFCSATYGVDFPMFAKVSVKGEDQAPLFAYLTTAENPDFTGGIKWNFEKFLVGKDGKLLHRFRSRDVPDGEKISKAVEAALAR